MKPTVTTGDAVKIGLFVTDFDSSKIRFLDDSHRFTAFLEYRLCKGVDLPEQGRVLPGDQPQRPAGLGVALLGAAIDLALVQEGNRGVGGTHDGRQNQRDQRDDTMTKRVVHEREASLNGSDEM